MKNKSVFINIISFLSLAIGTGIALSNHNNFEKVEAATRPEHGYAETSLYDGAKVIITTADTDGNKWYVPSTVTSSSVFAYSFLEVNSISTLEMFTVEKAGSYWRFYTSSNGNKFYLKRRSGTDYYSVMTDNNNEENDWTITSGTGYGYMRNKSAGKDLGVNSRNKLFYSGTTDMIYGSTSRFKFYTTRHTVTYHSNEGVGETIDSLSPYIRGETVTVLENGCTREKYTFSCWNTEKLGGGTDYNVGDTFTIEADTNLYAKWQFNGTTYGVTSSIVNGSIDDTRDVGEGETYHAIIMPIEHYHVSDDISVTMGGITLVRDIDYTINFETGEIVIPNVTAAINISGSCVIDEKYNVTYTAGQGGTGSDYLLENQWSRSYKLLSANGLINAGITALPTYKFDHFEVDGVQYAPGSIISFNSDIQVVAVFIALGKVISIHPEDFVQGEYSQNDGFHEFNHYSIYTENVRQSGDGAIEMNKSCRFFSKDLFEHNISLIKVVSTETSATTSNLYFSFDTTNKNGAPGNCEKYEYYGLGSNVFYIMPQGSGMKYFYMSSSLLRTFYSIEIYDEEHAAEAFSSMYLNAYKCAESGTSEPQVNDDGGYTHIEYISYFYNRLPNNTKTILSNAAINHKENYVTALEEFGQRYYLLVTNHGSSYDFMNLINNLQQQSFNVTQSNDNSGYAAAIIFISFSLFTAFFVISLINKKKKD